MASHSLLFTLSKIIGIYISIMKTKKINMGIIGAGRIGRVHAESLTRRLATVNVLAVADMQVQVEATEENDGLMLFRMTYGPKYEGATPRMTRMRVKVPIRADRALFYSAIGDTRAPCVSPSVRG